MFNIVLLEPEIPANTGNIGRTCLVTGARLHLIEPMGFIINDKNLKRAGMDYWHDLDVTAYDSLEDFVRQNLEVIDFPDGMLEMLHITRGSQAAGGPGCTDKEGCTIGNASRGDGTETQTLQDMQETATSRQDQEGSVCDGIPRSTSAGKARLWFATTKARQVHSDAHFQDGDFIMFGKESAGIPEEILMTDRKSCIRIPMAHEQRSLNLSNSAAIVLYEALRQNTYLDLETEGQLHNHIW